MEKLYSTVMEPFKIKSVEPLPKNTRAERIQHLIAAGYEPFLLQSKDVIIDLTTDSGTCAMSQKQWAAMMTADESYKNSTSFNRFKQEVTSITGFDHVAPVHQGRAAESLLFKLALSEGSVVVSNGLFFTTSHNIKKAGGKPIEIPSSSPEDEHFGGNIDCKFLEKYVNQESVTMVIITVTNNERAGQPVSMSNIRETSSICKTKNIPLFLDACRFAENAFFIKEKEQGFDDKSVQDIVIEMFSYSDGCIVSAKKDGLANIGGFFATRDKELFDRFSSEMMWSEGSADYGGLSGRDLDAIAVGFREAIDEDYLKYRISFSREFAEILKRANVPVIEPTGVAVHIDAGKALTHLPAEEYPARALNCALYIEGGVKGVQYSYKTGSPAVDGLRVKEVLRLSLPRRVYTMSHMHFVGEVFKQVLGRARDISGLKRFSEKINYSGARMIPIKGFIFASEAESIGDRENAEA